MTEISAAEFEKEVYKGEKSFLIFTRLNVRLARLWLPNLKLYPIYREDIKF